MRRVIEQCKIWKRMQVTCVGPISLILFLMHPKAASKYSSVRMAATGCAPQEYLSPNSPRHCRLLQFVALTRTQMISQGELIFEDTAPHVWYCNADSAKSCCCTCGKVTVCFTLARLSALRFASTHPLFGSCWRFRQALFSPVRFNPAAARFARRLAHRLLRITFSFAAQTHTCLHSRHTYSH